jgi:hypothetical protein
MIPQKSSNVSCSTNRLSKVVYIASVLTDCSDFGVSRSGEVGCSGSDVGDSNESRSIVYKQTASNSCIPYIASTGEPLQRLVTDLSITHIRIQHRIQKQQRNTPPHHLLILEIIYIRECPVYILPYRISKIQMCEPSLPRTGAI